MRKLILASSVLAIMGASSCSKSYTCTCTADGPTGTAVISNEAIPSTTHSKATSDCIGWQASQQQAVTNAGGAGYVVCSI